MVHGPVKQPPKPSGALATQPPGAPNDRRDPTKPLISIAATAAGATNLRMDFIQIAEGVKNGTLKPLGAPVVPDTWCVHAHGQPHATSCRASLGATTT